MGVQFEGAPEMGPAGLDLPGEQFHHGQVAERLGGVRPRLDAEPQPGERFFQAILLGQQRAEQVGGERIGRIVGQQGAEGQLGLRRPGCVDLGLGEHQQGLPISRTESDRGLEARDRVAGGALDHPPFALGQMACRQALDVDGVRPRHARGALF